MGDFLDATGVLARKEAAAAKRRECIEWTLGALGEFDDAIAVVDTRMTGVRARIYGIHTSISNNVEVGSGNGDTRGDWAWFLPILKSNDRDGDTENQVWGAVIGRDRQYYFQGDPRTPEQFASLLADASDSRIGVVRQVLEAALLEEPWSIRDALNAPDPGN